MTALEIVAVIQFFTLIAVFYLYEKAIKALLKREKAWGECCYFCGYVDGIKGNPKKPKTQEDVLAEIEEKSK